jgi:hypothetical protein
MRAAGVCAAAFGAVKRIPVAGIIDARECFRTVTGVC